MSYNCTEVLAFYKTSLKYLHFINYTQILAFLHNNTEVLAFYVTIAFYITIQRELHYAQLH